MESNNNFTRDDIAESIHNEFGLTKKDCSSFVNEIPSLFFMVYLFIIISFPDNQSIMNAKYIEIKEKLGIKENKYEF